MLASVEVRGLKLTFEDKEERYHFLLKVNSLMPSLMLYKLWHTGLLSRLATRFGGDGGRRDGGHLRLTGHSTS